MGDPSGLLARAYRARWPLLRRPRRVTYVIGRDRKVQQAFASEFRFAAHAEEISRTLGAARQG